MNSRLKRRQIAKWSLGLVILVVFVCAGQNVGFDSVCPLNPPSSLEHHDGGVQSPDKTENSQPCDLSEHRLQLHHLSFEHALPAFSLLFLLISWLITGNLFQVQVLTEPIPPTRRLHLTLCVFRE